MKALIVNIILIGIGVIGAYLGHPLITVLMIAVVVFRVVWPLIIRSSKKLPEKALDRAVKNLEKKTQESKGQPYIVTDEQTQAGSVRTHLGPNGPKHIDVRLGLDDKADGLPGAETFDPTQVTLGLLEMRTAEAYAQLAQARAQILDSDAPYYLKEQALQQLIKETELSSDESPKTPTRRRRKGEDFVGINNEGNYSIRE